MSRRTWRGGPTRSRTRTVLAAVRLELDSLDKQIAAVEGSESSFTLANEPALTRSEVAHALKSIAFRVFKVAMEVEKAGMS